MDQTDRTLKLGVLGLGDKWESRYLPILKKSKHRISIAAMSGRPTSKLRKSAEQMGAQYVKSIRRLMQTPDLQGILAFDSGWFGTAPLWLSGIQSVPIYWCCGFPKAKVHRLQEFHDVTTDRFSMIFPAFSWRYWPATIRLMELLATRFGSPKELTIGLDIEAGIDFARYVTKFANYDSIELYNGQPAKSGFCMTAYQSAGNAIQIEFTPSEVPLIIQCENGQASIKDCNTILWTSGDEKQNETLEQDRCAEEVMIDHFCRRLVGGLIPVPGFDDMLAVRQLTEQLDQTSH